MNEIDVIDRNDPEYTALLDNVGNAIEAGKGGGCRYQLSYG